MTTARMSPLAAAVVPAAIATADPAAALTFEDRSLLPRFGCKGRGAAAWLAAAGLPLPAQPNSWTALPEGGLVARLGVTEYLIEGSSELIARLARIPRGEGVYPVLREDAAIRLVGHALPELMCQSCSMNFAAVALDGCPVVLTSMVGVGVIVLPGETNGIPDYRIWCDGTWGEYLTETLLGIAAAPEF